VLLRYVLRALSHATRAGCLLGVVIPAGCAGSGGVQSAQPSTVHYVRPRAEVFSLEGDIRNVHDPAVIKEGDTYYLFSTGAGIEIRCSKDLRRWTLCGQAFVQVPEWVGRDFPGIRRLWAPDISRLGGQYYLYYAVSTFGSNRSTIGLATNKTLDPGSHDYRWIDEGRVIESRQFDDYNAIDPNLVRDENGQLWIVFGSFWTGIKAQPVDALTGKPAPTDRRFYAIASRPRGPGSPGAVEAPFIVRKGRYYYLFVSFDFCCRGIESTYRIVVGRSQRVTGPYVDKDGVPMHAGGGTPLVAGGSRWRGPGHAAILLEESGDKIVYHAYDAAAEGTPTLRIRSLVWDHDGWPAATNEE
jgi:arabinan endo-1,5-alpha-L-arabinosidase